ARRLLGCETNGNAAPGLDASFGDELVRELNTYSRADAVLTVSSKEASMLDDMLGDQRCFPVVDAEDIAVDPTPSGERAGTLFVGNFRHGPNRDAFVHLCRNILPKLDDEILARHPLLVVGNGLDDEVRALGGDHIRPIGWVPSLLPYFGRARVSVVPL